MAARVFDSLNERTRVSRRAERRRGKATYAAGERGSGDCQQRRHHQDDIGRRGEQRSLSRLELVDSIGGESDHNKGEKDHKPGETAD